jgi:hypothetical protein
VCALEGEVIVVCAVEGHWAFVGALEGDWESCVFIRKRIFGVLC